MTAINAELNRYNQSPRKTRLLTQLIKGKSASQAMSILSLSNRRGAKPLAKLLSSAIANAKNNFKLNSEELYVKNASVDGGVVMKRGMPRAFGRAYPIRKKTSDIKIVLEARSVATSKNKK